MTAAALPMWLAPDAPSVLMVPRPLAELGRPTTTGPGRFRHVTFAVVPKTWMGFSAPGLVRMVEDITGPTRCSEVVVQPAFDHDHVALYMTSPLVAHLPVSRLNEVLARYSAAGPDHVLLIAHCLVLWRQVAHLVSCS